MTTSRPLCFLRILVVAAIGLIGILASSCSGTQNARAEAPKSPDVPSAAVAKAAVEDISGTIVLTGEFKPYQEVEVMAKIAGYLKDITVDVGDHVKEGQLLAVIEVPEMADDQTRLQSQLNRSEAELARAKNDLQRAESAHNITHLSFTRLSQVAQQRPGLVAQQEIDDAQSKDLVAEAQISSAKSSVSVSEQQVQVSAAEVQRAKTLLEYTRVTAPFEGSITKRYADKGSMIQAGVSSSTQAMPLVRLSTNQRLRLTLPVPESATPTIHVGQQVEVRVPTLKRSFQGQVARFAEKVMSATRTMDTEVDVPNPGLVLVPGMYAEATLTLQRSNHVVTIPVSAVDLGSDETSGEVLVVTPENRIEKRTVVTGLQTEARIEIRSGLHQGELVVTGNRGSFRSGQEVRPKLAS